MTNTDCPLCKKQLANPFDFIIYSISGGDVVVCPNCSHFFTYFPHEVDIEELYRDDMYRLVDNRGQIYDRIIRSEYFRILKRIKTIAPEATSLLDFGCGKGTFLDVARSLSFKTKGLELPGARSKFAKEILRLDVSEIYYEGGTIDGYPFDVVVLLHVLEHLPNPTQIMNELLSENLTKDGIVVVEVPAFKSVQSRLARENWLHLDVPRHLSHFMASRLKTFLENLGLQIIRHESYSLHLGVPGCAQMIMAMFNYRGNLLKDLKKRKKIVLSSLLPTLPLSIIIETIASAFGQGGINRLYCRKKT